MKRYLIFLGWYLLVAVAGTGAIIALTPVLHASIPTVTLSNLRKTLLGRSASGGKQISTPPLLPEPNPVTAVSNQSAVAKGPAQPTSSRPLQSQPTVDESASFDYGRMWGVVRGLDASVFDRTGAAVAQLDPGTVVEIAAIRTSATDRVAICRLKGKTVSGNVALIRIDDLAVRTGTFTNANSDLVSLLIRQAVLAGEIETQSQTVAQSGASGNPHAAAYRKARDTLRDFLKTARSLKGKFDSSQGSERAQLMDRLRLMKQEEVQVQQAHNEVKARFDQWNAANASRVEEPAELRQMRTDLVKIESEIQQLNR